MAFTLMMGVEKAQRLEPNGVNTFHRHHVDHSNRPTSEIKKNFNLFYGQLVNTNKFLNEYSIAFTSSIFAETETQCSA